MEEIKASGYILKGFLSDEMSVLGSTPARKLYFRCPGEKCSNVHAILVTLGSPCIKDEEQIYHSEMNYSKRLAVLPMIDARNTPCEFYGYVQFELVGSKELL